jgi:hypothetical protein
LNGVVLIGANAPTYTVSTSAQNGAYSAILIDPTTGCLSDTSAAVAVTVLGTARELEAGVTFGLAPNPTADGRVTVTLAGPAATAGAWTLNVYDGTGRLLTHHTLHTGNATTHDLDWRALPAGVYTVRLIAPTGGALTRRLIRE